MTAFEFHQPGFKEFVLSSDFLYALFDYVSLNIFCFETQFFLQD